MSLAGALDGNGERQERGENVALHKRGKRWHTHFFVDGQPFRQSLDASDWREAHTSTREGTDRTSKPRRSPKSGGKKQTRGAQ